MGCTGCALGIEAMSQILDFYRGTCLHPRGMTFQETLASSDMEIEKAHDLIQWWFPLPEPSRMQPLAPVLTADDLAAFKSETVLRTRVALPTQRMMDFFDHTHLWRKPRDHNHLRITRIIRFFTLLGRNTAAQNTLRFVDERSPNVPESVKWYWREALNEKPAWLES